MAVDTTHNYTLATDDEDFIESEPWWEEEEDDEGDIFADDEEEWPEVEYP
jgi:hypothetical protein